MAKVVVMGAGIGGISQDYERRVALGKSHGIVQVGDSDGFELGHPAPGSPSAGARKARLPSTCRR